MRSNRGFFIANDGKGVSSGDLKFDTSRPHLSASLKMDPPHLDILETVGGTNFVLGAAPTSRSETLFTTPHKLPYTPELLIYYYAVSYNNDPNHANAGVYYVDRFLYGYSASYTDILYAEVDGTNFYIKHYMENYFSSGQTSTAANWLIRVKYYILSNDSGVTSYNTSGLI